GRGAFVLGRDGLRAIAMPNGFVPPAPRDAQFQSIVASPLMMDDGSVVFQATFAYQDPLLFSLVREQGIFQVDRAGTMTILARTTGASPTPAKKPFFRFREESASGGLVVFRAPVGDTFTSDPDSLPLGVFLADPHAGVRTVVMQNDTLPNGR